MPRLSGAIPGTRRLLPLGAGPLLRFPGRRRGLRSVRGKEVIPRPWKRQSAPLLPAFLALAVLPLRSRPSRPFPARCEALAFPGASPVRLLLPRWKAGPRRRSFCPLNPGTGQGSRARNGFPRTQQAMEIAGLLRIADSARQALRKWRCTAPSAATALSRGALWRGARSAAGAWAGSSCATGGRWSGASNSANGRLPCLRASAFRRLRPGPVLP